MLASLVRLGLALLFGILLLKVILGLADLILIELTSFLVLLPQVNKWQAVIVKFIQVISYPVFADVVLVKPSSLLICCLHKALAVYPFLLLSFLPFQSILQIVSKVKFI